MWTQMALVYFMLRVRRLIWITGAPLVVAADGFRPEHQRPLIDLDWRSWLPFGMQKREHREARAEATRTAANGWRTGREPAEGITASEASLQAYREQEQIVDVTGLKALPAAEISNLSARLLDIGHRLRAHIAG